MIDGQQRIRISRAAHEAIDAVVEVRWRAFRVPGIPDIAKDGSRLHDASRLDIPESIKVSVVVPLPAGPEHANDITTQVVFADLEDHAIGRADHRPAFWCEDVDAFVTSIYPAGSTPRIGEIAGRNFLDRDRER